MKVVRPVTVTAAGLTSSVPETAPAAYAGGTSYALAAQVSVISGSTAMVYESLAVGNVGHDPASSPDWWRQVATTYLPWNSGTTYAKGARVLDAAAHIEYQSLLDGNTNHAVTDPAWWFAMPSNRWRMFDQSLGSETVARDSVTVSISVTGRIDSVALLNVSAASARIVMTAAGAGTVYDRTINLASDSGITDWFGYFFEEVVRLGDHVSTDLPLYANPTITVTLTDPGSEVSIGGLVVGLSRDLGVTEERPTIGITDYSKKEADEFGNYLVVERAFSKRGRFTVWTENRQVEALVNLMAKYRATPVVWVGADGMAVTALFGFYKDFNVEISYPTMSICTLEIEGLT